MATRAKQPPPPPPQPLQPRTCAPCRKSKVKCDRRFPCGRCLRLRIPCEDPNTGGMEHVAGGLVSISHMVPTLATAAAFDLCVSRYGPKEVAAEKAASVMNVLAGIHRQKGCERLKRAVEELAQGLNADVGDLLRPRTEVEAAADTARLSDHFPFELASPELRPDQALHPYALELFQEPFITMVAVLVGGRERVFVNAAWAKSFFDAEACRQKLQDEGLRPTEIFGSVVHPDDRAFVVPLVDNCLFGCPDTLCESAHILRCHSPRSQAIFLALVRIRAIVTPEGYLSAAYSVQPLPFPPDMVKVSMPVGGVAASRQPWHDFMEQHERGEHSDTANLGPSASVPSSAASVASSSASASAWSAAGGRRSSRGSTGAGGSRRGSGRRGGTGAQEENEDEEYDESGRESFRSSDAGRDSFRYSDAAYSEVDDGGRESNTAEEAARAFAATSLADVSPRSSLGEDRPAAVPAYQHTQHAHGHLTVTPGGDGVGLRPPQPHPAPPFAPPFAQQQLQQQDGPGKPAPETREGAAASRDAFFSFGKAP